MDFAIVFKQMLTHPRCKGVTFWPLVDGRWQVNVAVDTKTNWIIETDNNPLAALWRCAQQMKER